VTRRVLDQMRDIASGGDKATQLTENEHKILLLIAEGKTNKEIAVEVYLSDKTVKNYLANIFQKLHISRRAQAASFFVRRQF